MERPLLQRLGEAVHVARRRLGWTLKELETRSGVAATIISRIETGQRPQVSFDVVARVVTALGISLDSVLHEDTPEETPEIELQPAAVG